MVHNNYVLHYTFKFLDIDLREGFILLPLFILIIILGFVPKFIFSLTNFTCLDILFELNQNEIVKKNDWFFFSNSLVEKKEIRKEKQ